MMKRYNNTMIQGIDRHSPIPLVYQLSEILRGRILGGVYKPNDPIPTEEQLAKEYTISRTTVRLAMAKLVNEGLIRRERGRGTFVNPIRPQDGVRVQRVARDMFEVKSTTHIIESAGMKLSTEVHEFELAYPSSAIAEQLDISESDPVLHFERLRLADGIPVVYERIWMPEGLCPGITRQDIEGSLYRTLMERYGLELAAAHQSLRAVELPETYADRLKMEAGCAVMQVSGVTFLDDGRPIEVEESFFRGDMMEFVIELGNYSKYARIRSEGSSA